MSLFATQAGLQGSGFIDGLIERPMCEGVLPMTSDRAQIAQQLTLDFPLRPALGVDDFFVSRSNQAAVELIDKWPDWPAPAVYLQGGAASGKSHLAHVWQTTSRAVIIRADCLSTSQLALMSMGQPLVIEDIDKGLMEERALFHLMNLAREEDFHLLLTGARGPGQIAIDLPDLRSRVRALPVVRIEAPDEALLRTLLIKQFQDRQLEVAPELIEYILPRMERSFSGASRLVERLDQLALSAGRRITQRFAGEVLRSFDWQEEADRH